MAEKKEVKAKENLQDQKTQQRFSHTCYPIYDKACTALILGTFPSVKSRETAFYYGHPQNRFWKTLSGVFKEETVPTTPEEKTAMLLRNHVALWDVIESCEVTGSSDSSIRNVVPNDIRFILDACNIRHIYGNGEMSVKLYNRYLKDLSGLDIIKLPSTSPANATYSLERLIECWSIIRQDCEE